MANLPRLFTQATLLSVLAIGGGYLQAQPVDEQPAETTDEQPVEAAPAPVDEQPADTDLAPADEQPAEAETTTPDVTQATAPRVEMSSEEMTTQAENLIGQMQEMLKRVLDIQQSARAAKDVIKLNCVNDKLLQVKQLLNIAESGQNNLTAAIAQGNDPARYHEFNQIKISHEKVGGLRDEAEACIGDEIVFVGDTRVDVSRPPVTDDPTQDDDFDFEVEVPGYASPFI